MGEAELRRIVRLIVVQELTLLAKALGGQSKANDYALASLHAELDREKSHDP